MGNKANKQMVSENDAQFVLSEENIKLLVDNTHFTRQQIEEWHSGFLVFDLILLFFFFFELNKKVIFVKI